MANQVTFGAMKKRRQQVRFSNSLLKFSDTLEPILTFYRGQKMTSWREKQSPEFTKHSTPLLLCSVQSIAKLEKFVWVAPP